MGSETNDLFDDNTRKLDRFEGFMSRPHESGAEDDREVGGVHLVDSRVLSDAIEKGEENGDGRTMGFGQHVNEHGVLNDLLCLVVNKVGNLTPAIMKFGGQQRLWQFTKEFFEKAGG